MKVGDLVALSEYGKKIPPHHLSLRTIGIVVGVSANKTCCFMRGRLPQLPVNGYPVRVEVMWEDGTQLWEPREGLKWLKKAKS